MTYLDASFLFSIHVHDANTAIALAQVKTAGRPLLVSTLCELEVVNAFAQRVYRGEISPTNMANAIRDLRADIGSGLLDLRPVPESAFVRAISLAQAITTRIGVRSADLLHVAAALELGAVRIYSFDLRQRDTAKAAGLKMNPLP